MYPLLIDIPTKNRPRELGRCLAALLGQTYQKYDLLIVNDNKELPIDFDPVTAEWLKRHRARRDVWVERGTGTSQVYAHNLALWTRPWRNYKYILRLDDDILLNSRAIEIMMNAMRDNEEVAAVSGLWFEYEENENWFSDREVPTRDEWRDSLELHGKVVDGVVSNWHQRLYHDQHPNGQGEVIGAPMRVEHLYSACLYRAEDMRRVGGWPAIYSQGVHHGEETDGTFRLGLTSKKLWVLPQITGQHLRASGGIRSLGLELEHKTRMIDDPLRNQRLRDMPGTYDQPIKVGLWGQHALFTGGGPRMFFEVLSALQEDPNLDVYPVGEYMDCRDVANIFSISVDDCREVPKELDVLIQLGDDLDWFDREREAMRIPAAQSKALFIYYPFGSRAPELDEFTHIVTLSKFVVGEIGRMWRRKATHIYPVARAIQALKKENWILVPGRIDQWKGTLWLMEAFAEMGLDGWQLHVAGATEGSIQRDYIQQVENFAKTHEAIHVHFNISQAEMDELYGKSRIMWAAKGLLAVDHPELNREAEHYGLTPLEAMSAGCVPLVYDMGGHRETTPEHWRWKTKQELLDKTSNLILFWEDIPIFPDVSSFFDHELFKEQWQRIVYECNARTNRVEPITLEISERKPIVFVVTDSPIQRKKTGFSVVGSQIVPGFVDQGWDVRWYAILDDRESMPGEFDFTFIPMADHDLQGDKRLLKKIIQHQPDVIWALYDAGNLYKYLVFSEFGAQTHKPDGSLRPCVAYFPVEGMPLPRYYGGMVEHVMRSGGQAITYTEGSAKAVMDTFEGVQVDWAWHGLDHAPFEPYPAEDRKHLRQLVGIDDYFVVGTFGVNKRTKQFDTLIYAAWYIKELKQDSDILFYCHTEPSDPILQGYPLAEMAEDYGVSHMFLWKPDSYSKRGGKYTGIEFANNSRDEASRITMPPTPEGRGFLFGSYDIVTRYNLLDLYVDVSSVEGWGLPLGEAMRCGVPGVSVNDHVVRSEIYADAAFMLEPSWDWETWHIKARLPRVHPEAVAQAILEFRDNPKLRLEYAERGRTATAKYKWQPTRDKMVEAVRRALSPNTGLG